MNKALIRYKTKGYKNVAGWLSIGAIQTIEAINNIQNDLQIRGSVGEIGVHHGKLFILLHLLSKTDEKSVAWDLFDNQQENIDKSGKGNKEEFLANLEKHSCNFERIEIISENSLNLNPSRMLSLLQEKTRLFSIDGGHTAEITYKDLENVNAVMCEGGIVIIDDYFNENWPGVSEGVCQYLKEYPQKLFPVAIAGNKFLFTNTQQYADLYVEKLSNYQLAAFKSFNQFVGQKIIILNFNQNRRIRSKAHNIINPLTKTELWHTIRNTKSGKLVRILYRRALGLQG